MCNFAVLPNAANGSENEVFCDFVLIHLKDTLTILDNKTKLQKRKV
jgi:hypothetical protein